MTKYLTLISVIFLFSSCSQQSPDSPLIHFTLLSPEQTGVKFSNTIVENDSVNLMSDAYSYMGSGVGVGDFNNDGLPDLFFGANQSTSRLYLNKGSMKFEDITNISGLHTNFWVTGVSVADVNNDGFDDIYLCVSGKTSADFRRNKLYINQGNLTFKEQAAEFGLDDTSHSTQAAFFDFDKDGDLDMYLLTHLLDHLESNNIVARDLTGKAPARDKLFRNNGLKRKKGQPYFEDVSASAGIYEDGYGLGVVITDINNDDWPDIYVANDYVANDVLWLNNRNGTFSNATSRSLRHQSYSSMGVDAADINNDGLNDVITLDMMPEDNRRKKLMYSFLNYERYMLEKNAGYDDQYIRNMLHLNNGTRIINDTSVPFFSEIGQLAGISETDWSWSVLLTDLDNDGWKDVYVTNGLGRDMINNDFISFISNRAQKTWNTQAEMLAAVRKKLDEFGTVELNNYCFRNNGDLTFANVGEKAGFHHPSISNGCAYADLDNDGDMDLAVNNINREAFIYQNNIRRSSTDSLHNFISITLKGDSLNRHGLGTRVNIHTGNRVQVLENNPIRGYLSTVDVRLLAGVGSLRMIDSIIVIWPDLRRQKFTDVPSNTNLSAIITNAATTHTISDEHDTKQNLLVEKHLIDFTHRETPFYDFGIQQLLPQKYSQLGPFLAESDVNGDHLTDVFIGGASKQSGRIFIQNPDGSFTGSDLVSGNKEEEDLGCLFLDIDNDGDPDLLVNSGSNEFPTGSVNYLLRLYVNDGRGGFREDKNAIPKSLFTSAQCIAASDYDGDGDADLFVGGRITPGNYPLSPESYLLRNNDGKFEVVTEEVCPELQFPGMVTAAIWLDFNGDGKKDLVIAGEWMSVRFFENEEGRLVEVTKSTGLAEFKGQWRSLATADLDKDGDQDIVAGNMGLNNKFRVETSYPMYLFAKDLDGNGSIDPLLAYFINSPKGERILYPSITRDEFAAQVPSVRKIFPYHAAYAEADMNTVLPDKSREQMMQLICNETRSVWFENTGNGRFKLHELPIEAQFAPVNTLICTDIDKDENCDIILGGNEYQANIFTGRYDASYGLILRGNGKGVFTTIPPAKSGFVTNGDIKDMKIITTSMQQRLLLVGVNNGRLLTFSFTK